jgi:serine/threonine protein kinase
MAKRDGGRLREDDPLIADELVGGRYRVANRVLGRGGMSVVVQATDEQTDTPVAIKVLQTRLADEIYIARFSREIEATTQIKSPHVVPIIGSGKLATGEPFMVMPVLEGADLSSVPPFLRDKISIRAVVDWMLQASAGVLVAHAVGIIHRDLKPANMFVSHKTNTLQLLDFGISKMIAAEGLTKTHEQMASDGYAPLEQFISLKDVDKRCDIFALGATFFRLLSGKLPFGETRPQQLANMTADKLPVPLSTLRPEVPEALDRIISRCLRKLPEDRYQTIEDLRADLLLLYLDRETNSRSEVQATAPTEFDEDTTKKATSAGARATSSEEDPAAAQAAFASNALLDSEPVDALQPSDADRSLDNPRVTSGTIAGRRTQVLKVIGTIGVASIAASALFFATRKPTPSAPSTIEPKPQASQVNTLPDMSQKMLDEAQDLILANDYEGAHEKVLGVPGDSPSRDGQVFKRIEAAWADALFRRAEQETGRARVDTLSRIAEAPTVDAERRKSASTMLEQQTAKSSQVSPLPVSKPSRVATPLPASMPTYHPKSGGRLVRETPF